MKIYQWSWNSFLFLIESLFFHSDARSTLYFRILHGMYGISGGRRNCSQTDVEINVHLSCCLCGKNWKIFEWNEMNLRDLNSNIIIYFSCVNVETLSLISVRFRRDWENWEFVTRRKKFSQFSLVFNRFFPPCDTQNFEAIFRVDNLDSTSYTVS